MTRLSAICALIEPADTVADVGCDHGKVAEYCASSGMFSRVIASDVSAACLDKARKRLEGRKNVEFVVCDGIKYACDEAVIAGMGGLLIADILKNTEALPKTLVLCPHRDCDALRRALIELGYTIERDELISERGKFYFVIRARRGGKAQELDDRQYFFGAYCDEKCELLAEYLIKLYNTYAIAPSHNKVKLELVRSELSFQGVEI